MSNTSVHLAIIEAIIHIEDKLEMSNTSVPPAIIEAIILYLG